MTALKRLVVNLLLAGLRTAAAPSTTESVPSSSTEFALQASTTGRAPAQVACGEAAARCWREGGLWHAPSSACVVPLAQGPCAETQWFVLDEGAAPSGRCALRPCPPGQLPFTGRCIEEEEGRETCWSHEVNIDATGIIRCGKHPGWPALLAARAQCFVPTNDSNSTDTTDKNTIDNSTNTNNSSTDSDEEDDGSYYDDDNSTEYESHSTTRRSNEVEGGNYHSTDATDYYNFDPNRSRGTERSLLRPKYIESGRPKLICSFGLVILSILFIRVY